MTVNNKTYAATDLTVGRRADKDGQGTMEVKWDSLMLLSHDVRIRTTINYGADDDHETVADY